MAEAKQRGKPLDVKVKERIAWFIGVGATQEEAAGACDVHRSTVAKVMADPVYRKQADNINRQRTSLRASARAVFADALNAFDSDGNPAHATRQRAAEALAKNQDFLEAGDDDEDLDASMLPGVTMLYPFADETLEPGTIEARQDGEVVGVIKNVGVLPVSQEHVDDAEAIRQDIEDAAARGEFLVFTEEDFDS